MAKYDHGGGCACGLYKECCCELAPSDETPKLWKDMTAEEKGALLLAAHEGKRIEIWDRRNAWREVSPPSWSGDTAYRVKPEPKRSTMAIYSGLSDVGFWSHDRDDIDTHKITFVLIDGEFDCDSIKMEKL